jgi:RND family efflux transporter MFP subunit
MAVAKLSMEKLHKKQSRVLAPDDGVISARSANVGAVAQAGQELFRLVRQGRLEWRAEVGVNDVAAISNGAKVRLQVTSGKSVTGVVRSIGPGVDTHTRNVLVYVDLPDAAGQGLKPGMFLQGDIQIGSSKALVVPASSVVLRDGVANVFVANDKLVVQQVAVKVGRESGALVEIQGIAPDAKVVANGAAFLADGDLVRIASDSKTAAPLKVAGKYGTS